VVAVQELRVAPVAQTTQLQVQVALVVRLLLLDLL
jgi:hypothetical protein